ncbi:hypothetical protein ASB62_04370 [Chlorobium limicola]|uniref:Nif11 domain-containing protein n=2 Tax=Chlorobium limicola TaxID=1092 RepID=A0A117MQI8_CHLLI|nr:hypothetical protein ASB62_04370 [Chlorobium limicola]
MTFNRLRGGEQNATFKIRLPLDTSVIPEPAAQITSVDYFSKPPHEKRDAVGESSQTHLNSPNGRCGFATGTQDKINQPRSNDMTIAQSKALYERLQADEVFRNRVLAADGMEKCIELIESYGFNCSNDEVQMALNKYTTNTASDTSENFTLWGNRIPR